MDVLVVGGSGLLGMELTRQARLAGDKVVATYHSRPPTAADVDWRELDIRDREAVTALAVDAVPDLIINAAYRQSDWATTADGTSQHEG